MNRGLSIKELCHGIYIKIEPGRAVWAEILVFLSTVCARRVVLVLFTNMDATIVVN